MIERYSRPEMLALWSDRARFRTWLDVELAALDAMEALSLAPAGSAAHVRARTEGFADDEDVARIAAIEREVRHDVIAFLTRVEERAGEPARHLHLGMTSSDVLDTAFALQLVRAADLITRGLDRVLAALAALARAHARTLMVGRTHGIHAEPTSFGLVCTVWYDAFRRDRARLARAREEVAVGMISGAVGTYADVPPGVEARACAALGLAPAPVSNQVLQRDRHAGYFATLAILGGNVDAVATNLRHLQRTEVREAAEPFGRGQKGSSAMPHKRNPVLCENLSGLVRLLRAHAGAAFEDQALWHERDISHSSVERVIGPDATILADFMLHRLAGVLEGLEVDPARMAENLALTGGLVSSGALLNELARAGLARQQAYALVQRHAMDVWRDGGDLESRVRADAAITAHLSPDALTRAFDPARHLAHVGAIYAKVFGSDGSTGPGVATNDAPVNRS